MPEIRPDLAVWMVRHAREDQQRGRLPDGLIEALRTALAAPPPSPVAATGNQDRAAENLDELAVGATPGQAADATGLAPRTVRHLASAGLIRARRVGARSWLVDVASVHDYLRGKTR